MGIEVSTYISGLTASWPPSGDLKSQGDDHLRLIKSVLQSTFPSASKAFYFPKGEAASTTIVLDPTDQNNVLFITTTGGDVAVTLPTGLVTADAGWSCEILKVSTDTNGAMVSPATGQIVSQVGSTNTIRVGAYCQPARFVWTGASWICSKPGALIGSTVCFDNAGIPRGYLALDGSAFNGTTFAELTAMLGTTTLYDKRGRVEAGIDSVTRRLENAMPGQMGLGGVGGFDYHTLTTSQIPGHTHSGTTGNDTPDHTHSENQAFAQGFQKSGGPGTAPFDANQGVQTGGASTRHVHPFTTDAGAVGGSWHPNVQPTIVTNKIIRAC